MQKLRIQAARLKNVAAFHDLNVQFGDRLNIICGTNGVGKSTILEAISAAFTPNYPSSFLKKRASASSDDPGLVQLEISDGVQSRTVEGPITATLPNENGGVWGDAQGGVSLIFLRASRDFGYSRNENISRDPDLDSFTVQSRQAGPFQSTEIKSWFANRYLMKPHGDDWPQYKKDNLEVARKLFSYLDASVTLGRVDTSTFDILVQTPDGLIPFEYLSSGFRSSYALLLGIIKEIEYRRLEVSAHEFSGVILIDEVDLHLHPTWQQAIGRALKLTFPSAQIIASTHSPHVVQFSDVHEIIALDRDGTGNAVVRKIAPGPFGFAGWTVEEVLQDVMGVQDTQTKVYREAVRAFDEAVDSQNADGVSVSLDRLLQMLHPSSPMRKVFEIQAAGYAERDDD